MALADALGGVKLSLFLTHRCTLRCRYCYNGRKLDRSMPWELARRAIDFGFEQAGRGFLLLSFFGGEPMLEIDRIEQSVQYARTEAVRGGRSLFLSVTTNATLLDDRRLDLLKRQRMRVQASIDGCRGAQDANRRFANGRSSFSRVSSNLVRLLGAGVPVRVVSVIDPVNVRWLVDSFDALRDLGVRNSYFVPNLQADWDEGARSILRRQLTRLADRWGATFRRGDDSRLDPFHGKVIAQLVRGVRSPVRCGFGRSEYAIAPTGRIYPCDRMVKQDDDDGVCLGDLESGLDLERRDRLAAGREQTEPECRDCGLRERCTYRCGCQNYETTGDVGKVSPLLCWFERRIIGESDRVANGLFAERNPAFLRRFYGGRLAAGAGDGGS